MITDYFSPKNKDEIEEKELESTHTEPKFVFLHRKDKNYTYQFIYYKVQSLQAHHLDISYDGSFMQSDFLLLSETWTILGDHFIFPGFKLCVQTYSSLNQTRMPSGVAIYGKENINVTKTKEYANYDNGIHIAVVYIQNNIRFAVLYAKPSSNTDLIFEAIKRVLGNDFSKYKTVLAANFNFDKNAPIGKVFCNMFNHVFWVEMQLHPEEITDENTTAVDSIFLTHNLKCCEVYDNKFSNFLQLYGRM